MTEPTPDPRTETPPGAKKALRKEVAEHITGQPTRKLFGTFGGVFAPTRLTTTSAEITNAATITLFSMTAESNFGILHERAQATGTPCIFAMDGGNENALA